MQNFPSTINLYFSIEKALPEPEGFFICGCLEVRPRLMLEKGKKVYLRTNAPDKLHSLVDYEKADAPDRAFHEVSA